ncbi:MAG: aspartate/glutamate racemase family protein [Chloroflexota bacterium]|nr:aspartate/glutamate racemase family protein [Chloroflexota bacterium]
MKIWCQTYAPAGVDPRWSYYGEAFERHARKAARADTEIHFVGVEKYAPRMPQYKYLRYMHIGQVIEGGLQAEAEGYDAFVLLGMLDLGFYELREALDIPVLFVAETSFCIACLIAAKFSFVASTEPSLYGLEELVTRYGLRERYVPASHMGAESRELLASDFRDAPKEVIRQFIPAARAVIERGAGVIVPAFGPLAVFLAEEGVHEVDGVPVLDSMAVLIKTAEMMVDLKKLGMPRITRGPYSSPGKEALAAARKLYGFE